MASWSKRTRTAVRSEASAPSSGMRWVKPVSGSAWSQTSSSSTPLITGAAVTDTASAQAAPRRSSRASVRMVSTPFAAVSYACCAATGSAAETESTASTVAQGPTFGWFSTLRPSPQVGYPPHGSAYAGAAPEPRPSPTGQKTHNYARPARWPDLFLSPPVAPSGAVSQPLVVDGVLDENTWLKFQRASPSASLTMVCPASERTEERVLFDDTALFIGILAFNLAPVRGQVRDLLQKLA